MSERNVFIITEEGRAYSDEALQDLRRIIKNDYKINDEPWFCMGEAYNDPSTLVSQLEKHDGSIIILSLTKGISVFRDPENVKRVTEFIKDNFECGTSYEILCEMRRLLLERDGQKDELT